jgi:hypothetical protein
MDEEEEEKKILAVTQASRAGWVRTRRWDGQRRKQGTRTSCRSTTSITPGEGN